jgi:hypothetical protein
MFFPEKFALAYAQKWKSESCMTETPLISCTGLCLSTKVIIYAGNTVLLG